MKIEFGGNVVLVDVPHIVDRFPADFLGSNYLHMAEPPVRVESSFRSNLAQLSDPGRPALYATQAKLIWSAGGTTAISK